MKATSNKVVISGIYLKIKYFPYKLAFKAYFCGTRKNYQINMFSSLRLSNKVSRMLLLFFIVYVSYVVYNVT